MAATAGAMRKQWKPPTPSYYTTAILFLLPFLLRRKEDAAAAAAAECTLQKFCGGAALCFFAFFHLKALFFPPFAVLQALLVNKALMKVELSQVLSTPHNEVSNPAERDEVGSYIYKKMAVAGLTVAMQHFSHRVKHIKRLVE